MPDPEIRELRYFRAVAEELNITRAAARLGIAQPPLSRAMRQLERRLGVVLFERGGPRLELTEAGQVLLAESAVVLGAFDSAIRRTRRGHGLVVTAYPGVATGLLHRIGAELEIRVVLSDFGEQADLVRDGRADVAIASCADDHDLDSEPLTTEARVAALAPGHALAAREALTSADLAGEPAPRWRTQSEKPHHRAGGPVVRDSAQLLEVVALGLAVALVPSSLAERNVRPDVTYRPVLDATPYRTVLLWPRGSRSAGISRFVRTALALAR